MIVTKSLAGLVVINSVLGYIFGTLFGPCVYLLIGALVAEITQFTFRKTRSRYSALEYLVSVLLWFLFLPSLWNLAYAAGKYFQGRWFDGTKR